MPPDSRHRRNGTGDRETPDGASGQPAAERAEWEVHRFFRRWVPWAIVYALGFLILWATGLAATAAFYAWAIGWALVWGAWVHADYVRRYLRPGGGRRSDPSED